MDIKASVQTRLTELPEQLRTGPLAMTALTLAEMLPDSSPRDAAALARELRITLDALASAAARAAPEEVDPVDELAHRRAGRIAAASDGAAVESDRR